MSDYNPDMLYLVGVTCYSSVLSMDWEDLYLLGGRGLEFLKLEGPL